MDNILQKIVKTKQQEVFKLKQEISLETIKSQALSYTTTAKKNDFITAIKAKHAQNKTAIIAEIKKASPSKGIICQNFFVDKIAKSYEDAGATCLSVLTDRKYFMGSEEYLNIAKQNSSLPILRKDFIIDEYQIYQSKLMGADAILLIASILTEKQMQKFEDIAFELELSVLPEIHHKSELEKAYKLNTPLFGINNRNLATFEVSLNQTLNLLEQIENKIIVTESGILSKNDIKLMQSNNVNTFLVGEAFMKAKNCGEELRKLFF
jgi:indole-3-glycerol phosphate synthase